MSEVIEVDGLQYFLSRFLKFFVIDSYLYSPIAEINDTVGMFGNPYIVSYNNDRSSVCLQSVQKQDYLACGLFVQCTRRLIGKDKAWLVHHRACNRDTLLLPT
ncbi:hypothetical protein NX79_06000 [Xanthomonas vasicola]|nr:hypothetical protein KWS_0124670 [Xanthomonas vasicola pv. musacearum NCPPB 4384]KGR44564.1 hypothetical protein NX04_06865 [Xanthomonas vasicola]KGR44819.1 hypothetical protein NX05_08740 [Xanthomonas vasicola]KGR61405.1 hypothetical protein NX79_06000 [Xanthomonas vasicola]